MERNQARVAGLLLAVCHVITEKHEPSEVVVVEEEEEEFNQKS